MMDLFLIILETKKYDPLYGITGGIFCYMSLNAGTPNTHTFSKPRAQQRTFSFIVARAELTCDKPTKITA